MKNTLLTLSLLLLLSSATYVSAGPSKILKFLMTEEVSLFDRGMDKLDSEFDGMEITSIGQFLTKVSYDWDENKILIASEISPVSPNAKNKVEAENWCKQAIVHMKLILGINGSIGNSLHEHSFINQYFSHYGFKNNKESASRGRELDWITRLKSTIPYNEKGKIDAYTSCEGTLKNNDIRFIE